jgi:predicted CopG family antitoxin
MHTLKINVQDEAYSHLIYILESMSSVEVTEDIINRKEDKLSKRVNLSCDDIQNGKVSDFDFDSFKKDLDV